MSSKKAENYVFDVTRRVVDIEKIIEFAKQVFSAYNTTYVENVYIIENGKLVIALSKRQVEIEKKKESPVPPVESGDSFLSRPIHNISLEEELVNNETNQNTLS